MKQRKHNLRAPACRRPKLLDKLCAPEMRVVLWWFVVLKICSSASSSSCGDQVIQVAQDDLMQ